MVETGRLRRCVAACATAALLAWATGTASAQPPVAKPQPPPKAPASGTTTTPTTTAKPTTPAPTPTPTPAAAPTTPRSSAPTPAGAPAAQAPAAQPVPAPTRTATASVVSDPPPHEAALGVPVLPNAVFMGSYDAGGAGQRFYLYGTTNRFADVVNYYRTVLRDKGELVFDVPATHTWEVGKFREDQVAFPPGVTVKDYTFAGSPGLANPRPGATPIAFPTVIQIVPPAAAQPTRTR